MSAARIKPIGMALRKDRWLPLPAWLILACALACQLARAAAPDVEQGGKHWAFRPVAIPQVPRPKLANWARTPIDAFILSALESKGLAPSPPAAKAALIRRATFDLTGLPPTPEEVESFVMDNSPEAFSRVVDRLLESPHYGERWGRHWLDVARYADSNGLDENVAYGNAWRYRDYVVAAFNSDKPFNRFVEEQIAGDLIPSAEFAARREGLVATGFLSLGAKVLAEPDQKKMEMDIIDEQIDTLGRTFMGMTLGCARCHAHKFDPIPTEDYYALAAIFKSTKTMNHFKTVAEWHEPTIATPGEIAAKEASDKEIARQKETIAKTVANANAALRTEARARAWDYLAAAAKLPANAAKPELEKAAAETNLRAPILKTCREYLAKSETNRFFATWREAAKLGGEAAAQQVEKSYRPLFEQLGQLPDNDKGKPSPAASTDSDLALARKALEDPAGFLALPAEPEPLYPGATAEELGRLRGRLTALEKGAPELSQTMGVSDSTNILKALAVHVRGSHLNLGAEAPRGFPRALGGGAAPGLADEGHSGRLELARWLTRPEHPLTARVMVNRIWRWHFGRGLVASTENFGRLGDLPSHPELLDWLAARFERTGWSVKAMHRLIMESAVYRQAAESNGPAPADSADPENRLLSRFGVRRLEAEEIRDSLLAVAGTLDPAIGGKTLPFKNRDYVFNHTSKDGTTYETARRSVYLPIIRNHLYGEFEQFDYPDPASPTGSRNETVVAPQALLMMNAELVARSAEALAKRFLAAPDLNDRQRLEQIYLRAYARAPSVRELDRATAFLGSFGGHDQGKARTPGESRLKAWTTLCHAVLAANEFSYLN